MTPLQVPGGSELLILLIAVVLNVLILIGLVGGLGYFLLRVRSGESVHKRLGRIEREVGRLEGTVEHLAAESDVELPESRVGDVDADEPGVTD